MKVYISTNIKKYRAKNKLTQKELANIFNVTPQAVSKWENETAYPDLLLIVEIASKFGVTVDEFLMGEIGYSDI